MTNTPLMIALDPDLTLVPYIYGTSLVYDLNQGELCIFFQPLTMVELVIYSLYVMCCACAIKMRSKFNLASSFLSLLGSCKKTVCEMGVTVDRPSPMISYIYKDIPKYE